MGENICKLFIQQGTNDWNIQGTQHQNTNNLVKKWAKDLNRHFSKGDRQITNRQTFLSRNVTVLYFRTAVLSYCKHMGACGPEY